MPAVTQHKVAAGRGESALRTGGLRQILQDDQSRATLLFLAPAIVYLAVMSIIPFVYALYLSFFRKILTKPRADAFIGLENYANLFGDALFRKALLNTFLITSSSILLELIIAFFVAKLFFSIQALRTSGFLRTLFIVPMMVTPVVTGLMFTYILNPTLGIANYLLSIAGLPELGWFNTTSTALMSIVLVNVWQWSPFLMLIMLAGLTAIPRETYEAAELDGAPAWRIAWHIEIPFISRLILVGVLLRVMDNFRLFELVYVATRGGPGDATETVSMFAYRQAFQFFNVGYGSAAAIVILAVTLALTTGIMRFVERQDEAR